MSLRVQRPGLRRLTRRTHTAASSGRQTSRSWQCTCYLTTRSCSPVALLTSTNAMAACAGTPKRSLHCNLRVVCHVDHRSQSSTSGQRICRRRVECLRVQGHKQTKTCFKQPDTDRSIHHSRGQRSEVSSCPSLSDPSPETPRIICCQDRLIIAQSTTLR